MNKKTILSGMRPTGKLHLGHWVGALSNWVNLQKKHHCFFMVADWHALMSEYRNPELVKNATFDNLVDWLSFGIDPEKSTIFRQSEVAEHLELFMILSVITPLGWLWRCPTFKEQIKQLKEKNINTYAFLGYPALQASDIALYKADCVPVGNDQLPHLELAREIVRRFNSFYKNKVLKEPKALLTKVPRLGGLDGRKMSKSYNNYIALDEEDQSLKKKVLGMFTDPARKRKSDPGNPKKCNVFSYYQIINPEREDDIKQWCHHAQKGCVECKKILLESIRAFIAPKREKKREILKDKKKIYDILKRGEDKARQVASLTLKEVKEAMQLIA
ncbi:MAG: tryptophan--tRNA ligase [Candidatus Omnitrophica bacterium]|nr:tryptophan--tRNA ligase [Candidatus Omnitrophota bacterium]MCF7892129.1 tryptophan--tRNA ligase [Candidatus Omnitrophota bacterium]MCF7897490.1 tryptophan--tRNA ligase [Candidatus Omnitrophota bacterium]MCF7909271.1 tryptophan--tRNA ligase [Candidatus Omnitrophota bacterium]